jgi:endonuclease/exonuclease/phosphatase (EEP) superfamily protein YafD
LFVGAENPDDPRMLKDCIEGGRGIDWILYKGNVDVVYHENVDYNVEGVYPSDHNPVYVELKILDK